MRLNVVKTVLSVLVVFMFFMIMCSVGDAQEADDPGYYALGVLVGQEDGGYHASVKILTRHGSGKFLFSGELTKEAAITKMKSFVNSVDINNDTVGARTLITREAVSHGSFDDEE